MSILDHSGNHILPIEAELIARAREIERRMLDGETVGYEEYDELDDMRRDEIERRHNVVEEPGAGWRIERSHT